MSTRSKKIFTFLLSVVITCLALSCDISKYHPIQKEDCQIFKSTYTPRDTVYVDPITVSTTTDPEN
jgi:hypothetical protein